MKCDYCDSELVSMGDYYSCRNSSVKEHDFNILKSDLDDKYLKLKFGKVAYCFYNVFDCTGLLNDFQIKDFAILKKIKTEEELINLVNKIRIFK